MMLRAVKIAALCGAALTIGAAPSPGPAGLPAPPANGELGFVVSRLVPSIVKGMDSCPGGPVPKMRQAYLQSLPEAERTRLSQPANEPELTKLWQAQTFGPNGTNICSNPELFDRPMIRTVQSRYSLGLDLDSGGGESCAHDEFESPDGRAGIDNQEYRVMGCTLEVRGNDGNGGDAFTGTHQFITSGEWTQVILLRGVDSLVNDAEVEVIYANTPDRPVVDSTGRFLRGASFAVSDTLPRRRNVLRGQIANGVLTTAAQDIKLTQTWGQGGARDIRGNRTSFDYRSGQLRLTFQPDGTLTGLVGGYRPVFDVIQSPAIGAAGSAVVAGIDCAGILATLRKHADGIRDPKTGKCSGVSAAMELTAIPAYVTDRPASAQSVSK
jgi:hypothetical protein